MEFEDFVIELTTNVVRGRDGATADTATWITSTVGDVAGTSWLWVAGHGDAVPPSDPLAGTSERPLAVLGDGNASAGATISKAVDDCLNVGAPTHTERQLGAALGLILLPRGELRDSFLRRLETCERSGIALRMCLRAPNSLDHYPWELASLASGDTPLAARGTISIVRQHTALGAARRRGEVPIKIAMVDALSSKQHIWQEMTGSFSRMARDLLVDEPRRFPTRGDLEQLQGSVLHFHGHGKPASEADQPTGVSIWFESKERRDLTADEFVDAIRQRSPGWSLVVLAACAIQHQAAFGGIGYRLREEGVRAVIASSAYVMGSSSTAFFGLFYEQFGTSGNVEQALMAARRRRYEADNDGSHWWVHALYCNDPDGLRFVAGAHSAGLASSADVPHSLIHFVVGDVPGGSGERFRLEVLRDDVQKPRKATDDVEDLKGVLGGGERRDFRVARCCPSGRVIAFQDGTRVHFLAVNLLELARGGGQTSELGSVKLPPGLDGIPRLLAIRSDSTAGSGRVTAVIRCPTQLWELTVDLATERSDLEFEPASPIRGEFHSAAVLPACLLAVTDAGRLEVLRGTWLGTAHIDPADRFYDVDSVESPVGSHAVVCLATTGGLLALTDNGVQPLPRGVGYTPTTVQLIRQGRAPASLDALTWSREDGPLLVKSFVPISSGVI